MMSLTSPGVSSCSDYDSFLFSHAEGYNVEFDPPLDAKYDCPICLSTLREPQQTPCGHRFCRDCILRWLRDSGKRCPIDNEELSEEGVFADNFAKREILNCSVKCPNHKDGCESKVILNQLRAHLDMCPAALKPCPFNCASILPQREMREHLEKRCQNRPINCPLCHANLKAVELMNHAMTCPKETVECQYCGEETKRDEVMRHVNELCQKVSVPCPFNFLGCHSVNERCQENEHLKAEAPSHMRQLSQIIASLLQQFEDIASRVDRNGIRENYNQSALEMIRTLSHMKVSTNPPPEMSSTPNSYDCSSFSPIGQPNSSPDRGYSRSRENCKEVNLHSSFSDNGGQTRSPHSFPPAGTHRSFSEVSCGRPVAASAPQSASGTPQIPFFPDRINPTIPFQLPNSDDISVPVLPFSNLQVACNGSSHRLSPPALPLSNTDGNSSQAMNDNATEKSKVEGKIRSFGNTLQELCVQQSEDLACQQKVIELMYDQLCQVHTSNKDLIGRVRSLESQRFHFDTRSHCGDFYWPIADYKELRQKAGKGETTILHSNPFLTSPWGYKLCIRANVSGFVNGDHEYYLSLFIHFMQGSNDNLLRWPFKGQIVLSVMDQNENYLKREHITETLEAKPHLEAFKQPINIRNHKGFGFTEFVTLSTLESGSFIRNGTIVIRAQVFPEN